MLNSLQDYWAMLFQIVSFAAVLISEGQFVNAAEWSSSLDQPATCYLISWIMIRAEWRISAKWQLMAPVSPNTNCLGKAYLVWEKQARSVSWLEEVVLQLEVLKQVHALLSLAVSLAAPWLPKKEHVRWELLKLQSHWWSGHLDFSVIRSPCTGGCYNPLLRQKQTSTSLLEAAHCQYSSLLLVTEALNLVWLAIVKLRAKWKSRLALGWLTP